MAASRGKQHYLFDRLGLELELEPEPWTPADCIVSWWHLGQFFAGDGTRELIHYRNTVGGGAEPAGSGGSGSLSRRRRLPRRVTRKTPDHAAVDPSALGAVGDGHLVIPALLLGGLQR